MYPIIILISLIMLTFNSCSGPGYLTGKTGPLAGINIAIDPGHGDTKAYDDFRIGPTGEREEWINLRVAKILAVKLSRAGANVLITRTSDRDLSLGGRAALAKKHKSNLLVSIHHNGSEVDREMDFPIVYFYGPASLNPASLDFAELLFAGMQNNMTFEQPEAGAVYSDHLIYSSGTSILRNTIDQMPGVIGEGGFFTNPAGEARLKSRSYNKLEAEVYFKAILEYITRGLPSAVPVRSDSSALFHPGDEIKFQLDDGFGSWSFDESEFLVLQDGDTIQSNWNASTGRLSAQPVLSDEESVSFQVFGRNTKGNALHPKPFVFTTETGDKQRSYTTWQSAFDAAEQILSRLITADSARTEDAMREAIQLYRLSLDIQIVHPRARLAEERILTLLERLDVLSDNDLSTEIEAQKQRLMEYYPARHNRQLKL